MSEEVPLWLYDMHYVVAISFFAYAGIPLIIIMYVVLKVCKSSKKNDDKIRYSSASGARPGWIMVLLAIHYFFLVFLVALNITFNISTLIISYGPVGAHYIIFYSNIIDILDVILNIF